MSNSERPHGHLRETGESGTPAAVARAGGKVRRTQAERSSETRGRILKASVTLMRKRGYANFRTAEVAELAGVSRGAQLHHFPTKESLVFATLEHVFDSVLEATRKRAQALKPGDDVLQQIIDDAREFFFNDEFFITLDIVMSTTDQRLRRKVLAMARSYRLPAERAWRDALVGAGVPESTVDDLLWLTLSIVRGLAIRILWQNEPQRFDHLFDIWREMATQYILNKKGKGKPKGR